MKYDIGNFVIFKKVVQRYSQWYDSEVHKIAYISNLKNPYPVGQIVGFKYLKFGISNYDLEDGNSFHTKITVPCYEVKIGVMNKPFYVREQDLMLCKIDADMDMYKNLDVQIIPKCYHTCCNNLGVIVKLKMKVRIDGIVTFKNNFWCKGQLDDNTFLYEED